MSSERRYQSQLFNFIWHQSLKLTARLQQSVRYAKGSVLWGGQVVLYPAYLLFHLARRGERVLRLGDTQGKRILRTVLDPEQEPLLGVEADFPITRVLDGIQIQSAVSNQDPNQNPSQALDQTAAFYDGSGDGPHWTVSIRGLAPQRPKLRVRYQQWWTRWSKRHRQWLVEHRLIAASPNPTCRIGGVASIVSDRHIVLVAGDNTVLDVLSADQQHQLRQLMIWEIANYQRRQRLNRQLHHLGKPRQPLPLPVLRPQMLLPVRVFRQLMAWVQVGPIVTDPNLFQKPQGQSQLALTGDGVPTLSWALPASLQEVAHQCGEMGFTQEAVDMIDQAIASWEANPWSILGPTAHNPSDQRSQQHQQQSLPGQIEHLLRHRLGGFNLTQGGTQGKAGSLAHVGLKALRSVPSTLRSSLFALLGLSSSPPCSAIAVPSSQPRRPPPDSKDPLGPLVSNAEPTRPWLTWAELYGPRPTATTSSQGFAAPTAGHSVIAAPVVQVGEQPPPAVQAASTSSDISVDAVVIGYEKHLLEHILAGLDRVVACLEAWAAKLWRHWWPSLKQSLHQFFAR